MSVLLSSDDLNKLEEALLALLKENKNLSPVLITSSIQAALDNAKTVLEQLYVRWEELENKKAELESGSSGEN